jgi:hypothetical protein
MDELFISDLVTFQFEGLEYVVVEDDGVDIKHKDFRREVKCPSYEEASDLYQSIMDNWNKFLLRKENKIVMDCSGGEYPGAPPKDGKVYEVWLFSGEKTKAQYDKTYNVYKILNSAMCSGENIVLFGDGANIVSWRSIPK